MTVLRKLGSAEPSDRRRATLVVDGSEIPQITSLVKQEQADTIVVGLPRGLDGQVTDQTVAVQEFIAKLQAEGLSVQTIDEAGTSVEAEKLLAQKDRPRWPHESVDALAAMILLNDYFDEHGKTSTQFTT